MRRQLTLLGAAGAALLTATFSVLPSQTGRASGTGAQSFIVPASDGYGVGECVVTGSACAKVVADAWCEAQGFSRSASFGLADAADVTASIGGGAASRPIAITCQN